MSYLLSLQQALRGCACEPAYVVLSPFFRPSEALQVYAGDPTHWDRCGVDVLQVLRFVARSGQKSYVFAHGHPTPGWKYPSFNDLGHCARLQQLSDAWGLTLSDYVIITSDGLVFSFRAEGIFTDPLVAGRPFATKAVALAYGAREGRIRANR